MINKIVVIIATLLFLGMLAIYFSYEPKDEQETFETLYCYESIQLMADGSCPEGHVRYMQKVGDNEVQTFCKRIYCVEGKLCHKYDGICDIYEVVQKLP